MTNYKKIFLLVVFLLFATLNNITAQDWVAGGPDLPDNIIKVRKDKDSNSYICRGKYGVEVLPGMLDGSGCHVISSGNELILIDYELLVGDGDWAPAKPKLDNAFVASELSGKPVYLCSVKIKNNRLMEDYLTVEIGDADKIITGRTKDEKCSIVVNGREILSSYFQVFYSINKSRTQVISEYKQLTEKIEATTELNAEEGNNSDQEYISIVKNATSIFPYDLSIGIHAKRLDQSNLAYKQFESSATLQNKFEAANKFVNYGPNGERNKTVCIWLTQYLSTRLKNASTNEEKLRVANDFNSGSNLCVSPSIQGSFELSATLLALENDKQAMLIYEKFKNATTFEEKSKLAGQYLSYFSNEKNAPEIKKFAEDIDAANSLLIQLNKTTDASEQIRICREFLLRYPGHPSVGQVRKMFQGLEKGWSIRATMNLYCFEQNEGGGDDEIYVTATIASSYGGDPITKHVWGGNMNDDGSKRNADDLLVWEGTLRPDEVIYIHVNLIEQDGVNYEPGLQLAADLTQQIAQAYSAAKTSEGGATQAATEGKSGSSSTFLKILSGLNWSTVISKACGALGPSRCLNTDDFPGSYLIRISYSDGKIKRELFPIWNSRKDTVSGYEGIRFDGDGSDYFAMAQVGLQ